MKIEKNKDLTNLNTFKIKVKSKYFVELKNKSDFREIFIWMKNNKIKNFFILGEGANVIFTKNNFAGPVIKINIKFIKWKNKFQVEVGAGRNWDNFLLECQRKKIYEIQSLAGIPGTVGAGVFGNIGAFGTEIKKYILGAWVFDKSKKEFIFLNNEELKFSYRHSFLKERENNFLIYSVIFDFSPTFQAEINKKYINKEYFSWKDFAQKYNLGKIKKLELRKSVKKIRRLNYPDLKKFPNVGSVFKNAEISDWQLKKILKQYPDLPNWKMPNGKNKIPTAFILDKILNLKGKKFKNLKIDEKRPLFIINLGETNGQDFIKFCQYIQAEVWKKNGVKIELEVRLVG